jgi:gas vesicle protein
MVAILRTDWRGRRMMGNKAEFLGGILLGALIGAALGLMFAPQPGTDTRAKIGEKAGEAKDTTMGAAKSVYEKGRAVVKRESEEGSEGD